MTKDEIMFKQGYLPAVAVSERMGNHPVTVRRWISSGVVRGMEAGGYGRGKSKYYVYIESLCEHLGEAAKAFGFDKDLKKWKEQDED